MAGKTRRVSAQGRRAMSSGMALEQMVETMIVRHGVPVFTQAEVAQMEEEPAGPCLIRNFRYRGLWSNNRSEFFLKGASPEEDTFIECRWQAVAGTTDEKLVYLLSNALRMPAPIIILVIAGGGARAEAIEWIHNEIANPYDLHPDRFQGKTVMVMSPEELLAYFTYRLPEQGGTTSSLRELVRWVRPREMPAVTFPQADQVRFVAFVADVAQLRPEGISAAEVGEWLGVSSRQGGYYADAALFVGLVQKEGGLYRLSEMGHTFVSSGRAERVEMLVRAWAALPVFHEASRHVAFQGTLPKPEWVEQSLKEQTAIGGATLPRRARTPLGWLRWAQGATGVRQVA